jgi:hypothetical protein
VKLTEQRGIWVPTQHLLIEISRMYGALSSADVLFRRACTVVPPGGVQQRHEATHVRIGNSKQTAAPCTSFILPYVVLFLVRYRDLLQFWPVSMYNISRQSAGQSFYS